jgi:enoyl-CoA hydratase/carnithine racemase
MAKYEADSRPRSFNPGVPSDPHLENHSQGAVMDKVRFETSGALGILSLANPPLNLFSGELIEDLRAAVTQIKRAPLRALLVRADGKIFSGGADVSVFKGITAVEARERFTSHLRLITDLEELPFPTIVAVQGLCIAAGLELALACDLIWAAAAARFGQIEASIGTTTLLGGVQRLAERAGPARAREIIYTADQYDAATFERWNIVNRIVPDEALESQTRAFAERLANGPTRAYAVGKRIVRAYLDGGVRTADKVVDEAAPALFDSEDMRAGVAGVLEHGVRNFRDKIVFHGR